MEPNGTTISNKEKEVLINRYPAEALKGKKALLWEKPVKRGKETIKVPVIAIAGREKADWVSLDAEWKRAFVGFRCIAMIHLKVYNQMLSLTNQLSEDFNKKFGDGVKIELTPEATKNLMLMFRIQNILSTLYAYIEKTIPKIDTLIVASKDKMDQELFMYYIPAKTLLLENANQYRKLANDITNSENDCFKEERQLAETAKRETLEPLHTLSDLDGLTDKFMGALGLVKQEESQ